MATVNFFENAKTVSPSPKSTLPAATKPTIEGLQILASIDCVVESLKGVRATYYAEARRQATEEFLAVGIASGRQPGNFKAEEHNAIGSIELRKRGSNRPLDVTAIALLAEHSISVEEKSDAVDTYIVNPDRLEWLATNGDKVNEALSKIKGCPHDLFQKQTGNKVTVTTTTTIDECFRNRKLSKEVCAQLLACVADVSIGKFVLNEEDAFRNSLKRVLDTIAPPEVENPKPTKRAKKA